MLELLLNGNVVLEEEEEERLLLRLGDDVEEVEDVEVDSVEVEVGEFVDVASCMITSLSSSSFGLLLS